MNSHYRAVCLGLQAFASKKLGKYLHYEECESGLLNYIDEYSIECVEKYKNGAPVPIRGKDPGHWRFIVSSFINHISSVSPEFFRYFVTVLTGRMLANALLASDLSGIGAKFRQTSIYLDTPLILQFIGVVGNENQIYTKEICKLLLDAGAELKVFSHTIEEIDQVIRNAEKFLELPSGGQGDVVVALREAGFSSSDLALIRARLRNILWDGKIKIEETPKYIEEYQIDELALQKEMDEANLRYRNRLARDADINSVRSVYVIRRGTTPHRVEDCLALVVTTNSAFARAAYSYGRKYEEFKKVSPVITDFSLVNIVWLKSPLKHINLPVHLLLSNCYSVLKPSEALWDRFVTELNNLREQKKITPEEHQYLRYELKVRDDLMNLTLGDEQQVSDQVVLEILDRHEQEIIHPWKDRLEQVELEKQEALDKLSHYGIAVQSIEDNIKRLSHTIFVGLRSILIIIVIFFLLNEHGIFTKSDPSTYTRLIISWVIGSLIIGLSLANQIFGFKIIDPVDNLCLWLEKKLSNFLKKFIGLKKES